jgi:hypothetical protein
MIPVLVQQPSCTFVVLKCHWSNAACFTPFSCSPAPIPVRSEPVKPVLKEARLDLLADGIVIDAEE